MFDDHHHLLFGLIALQAGLIDEAQLIAAFRAWARHKDRPLADHLVDRGALDPAGRVAVDALAALHLRKHGDTEESLAALPDGRSVREILARLVDSMIEGTPARTGSASTAHDDEADPDGTGIYSVGMIAGDGQRFRILRPHARGGLGVVYIALDSELNREVALKRIVDKHADDPASRQRFLVEAEVTGGLEHPGIVPVYGLGTHADGRPYYAMRFVRGDNLKEAIDRFHADEALKADPGRRSLALRQLLRRFLDVCNAIDYAHSRGVLHRDIKPGNVIVGRHGETLVVDWGLAKATGRSDPGAGERTLVPGSASGSAETLPGSALGTPAYMSPEQARGDLRALGPASDIYSLGATLYCLLTRRAPFEGDAADVLRAVQRGDSRPPRSLDPSIDKALEAVCLKAMASRPEDRYASCRELAEDVERWLADEPVSTYREPATARLVRWGRRHRTLVAGLAATLVVAVVALTVGAVLIGRQRAEALRQRDRAEDNLALARQTVDEMYTRAAGRLTDLKGMDADQRDLLVKAAQFYERFALPQSADPAVRLEAGRAGLRAGEILARLGQTGPAEAAYVRALRLLEAVAAADPADAGSRRALADGHYGLSDLLRGLGRKAQAEASLWRAAEIHGRLTAADPEATAPRRGLAVAHIGLGNIEGDLGRPADAEDAFRTALALLEALTRDHPGVAEYRSDQATAWNCLADLQRRLGRSAEAIASWERALAADRVLARDHPEVARYRAALARVAHNLGTVRGEVGRLAEAMESYRRAAEVREALARDHPDVPLYRYELAGTYNNLGNLLRDAGETAEARRAFEQAVAIKERLAGDHPDVAEYRSSLANSLANLGFLLDQIGFPAEALPPIRRAATLQERLVRDHPDAIGYRGELASSLAGIGSLRRRAGDRDEALRSLRRALELWGTLPLGRPSDLYNLACAHAQCCALIDGGRGSPSPGERAERDSHGERAMAALRRALAAGFAAPSWLARDPDLDPLRSREDFRALMMDLAFPADPFARLRSTP